MVVNGQAVSSDLVPRPWGRLMAFETVEALLVAADPATMTRRSLADGGESLTFSTATAQVSLRTNADGIVMNHRVADVSGRLLEEIILEEITPLERVRTEP